MSYSNADKVGVFQFEVLGNFKPYKWRLPTDPLKEISYLTEEISELAVAMQKGNVPDTVDALMDLLYFAYGLGYKMGIPVDECFQIVHLANMKKVSGKSTRYLTGDAEKPAGWEDPKITLKAMYDAS